MEDNSRKEMVPLNEKDLEEVSGGKEEGCGAAKVIGYSITRTEKDENSKAMHVNSFHFDCGN